MHWSLHGHDRQAGTGQLHLGIGGDAAIELAVLDDLPFTTGLLDLDNSASMGSHLDINTLLVGRSDFDLALGDL